MEPAVNEALFGSVNEEDAPTVILPPGSPDTFTEFTVAAPPLEKKPAEGPGAFVESAEMEPETFRLPEAKSAKGEAKPEVALEVTEERLRSPDRATIGTTSRWSPEVLTVTVDEPALTVVNPPGLKLATAGDAPSEKVRVVLPLIAVTGVFGDA